MNDDIIIEVPTEVITIEMTPEGKDGQDGFSPIAAVSKSGKTATITITDKTGTTTASVTDGEDGQPGPPGTTTWEGITDKPESFPPSAHTHTVTDITDFPTLGTMSAEDADDYYDKDAVDDALDTKAPVIVSTASGAIAHITDAAAGDAVGVTIEIKPVQDLHGYDAPWPAGGGKNLLPLTVENLKSLNTSGTWTENTYALHGITYAVTTDDGGNVINITVSGTLSSGHTSSNLVITGTLGAGSYILNGCPSGGSGTGSYRIRIGKGSSSTLVGSDTGSERDFTFDESTDYDVKIYIETSSAVSNLVFKPMIRLSTAADATFAPYSNVCPISGHATATVTRTGKNLFDLSADKIIAGSNIAVINGTSVTNTSTARYAPIRFSLGTLKAGTYTISIGSASAVTLNKIYAEVTDFHDGVYDQYGIADGAVKLKTFTVPKQINGVLSLYAGNNDDPFTMTDIQIEYGSTATVYTPYQGQTVTINLNGTYYGATVDVRTGVMTVNRAYKVATSSEITYPSANNNYSNIAYASVPKPTDSVDYGNYGQIDGAISDTYSMIQTSSYDNAANIGKGVTSATTNGYWFGFPHGTTLNDMKTVLTGVQIVYELATPFTVQLTPAELSLLYGDNNVWSNTGDVSVGYKADTKLYIDRKIAELQALILDN